MKRIKIEEIFRRLDSSISEPRTELKFESPFNTYLYRGLPPKPISYVGKKTLDILFENHKTDFLFYFFNNSLKRHEFSKTFNDHKKKLNEYRDTK